ncbi:hypothetical protein SAMN05192561_11271 [Halopenitus malekzadehii]|uniref:Small CPxCG-related zinc finger protein n=1 Tax=Halopenitus malekzadehii TaxID=1267564 RepID=A0A1H6JGN9_9EURY|nr:hypothetical protein [Halopenitus malekzadehii]SEH61109.1 hypothetical protein SAMN05192561_11271 [Halopenitus malekzadehii]
MSAWERSTIDCTDCDGEAVAKTDQWGQVIRYECPECDCQIDPGDV